MPRVHRPRRTLGEIFTLAEIIGAQNVLLNDAELGAVLAGDDATAAAPGTVANWRYFGRLTTPIVKVGRSPKTRLSDALAYVQRKTRSAPGAAA